MDDGGRMDEDWVPRRGVKRRAEDDLRDDQPLVKRFHLLNLEHNGSPFASSSQPSRDLQKTPAATTTPSSSDIMQLDDTKDKVYIYNLDAELQEVSSEDEEKVIFLPDIDQKLTKIPRAILQNPRPPRTSPGNEVVLYNVPTSLSVPEEHDSVRKAIIDARVRAREKQADELRRNGFSASVPEEISNRVTTSNGMGSGMNNRAPAANGIGGVMTNGFSREPVVHTPDVVEEDPDAMEIEQFIP